MGKFKDLQAENAALKHQVEAGLRQVKKQKQEREVFEAKMHAAELHIVALCLKVDPCSKSQFAITYRDLKEAAGYRASVDLIEQGYVIKLESRVN